MKKIMVLTSILVFLFTNAFNQNDSIISNRKQGPFQVTFVPPIGTNGIYSKDYSNDVSLNVLVGVNGGVNKFEIGGFGNINHGNVNGAQFGGFGNLNSGDMTGAQISGFFNVNGGTTSGLQGAGFLNINGNCDNISQVAGFINLTNEFTGFQGAGFGNVAGNFNGAQGSGFINIGANLEGVQATGFINIADSMKGMQGAGFINIADDVDGLQIAGFINIADKVKGYQVAGFINICDSIDGIPIGLLNIVKKNGYRKVQVSTNETYYVNLGYKIGVKEFYTILSAGIRPGAKDYMWGYGLGFGTNIAIDENKSLDIEALHMNAVRNQFWDYWDQNTYYYNNLNRVDVNFNYHLDKRTTFYAGPSFNVLVTEESAATILAPKWAFKMGQHFNTRVHGWFGFNAGIQF